MKKYILILIAVALLLLATGVLITSARNRALALAVPVEAPVITQVASEPPTATILHSETVITHSAFLTQQEILDIQKKALSDENTALNAIDKTSYNFYQEKVNTLTKGVNSLKTELYREYPQYQKYTLTTCGRSPAKGDTIIQYCTDISTLKTLQPLLTETTESIKTQTLAIKKAYIDTGRTTCARPDITEVDRAFFCPHIFGLTF